MPAASAPEGLPAPTGRHWVGRVSFEWVDPSRTEVYSSNPQDRRELVVWVWYPATPRPGAERAAYLPEAWAPTGQLGRAVVGPGDGQAVEPGRPGRVEVAADVDAIAGRGLRWCAHGVVTSAG